MASSFSGNAHQQFSPFPDAPAVEATAMPDSTKSPSGKALSSFLVADAAAMPFDLLQEEVRCARLFNLDLPEPLDQAIQALLAAMASFTRSQVNCILWFNAVSGHYICLNDLITPGARPRELRQVTTQAMEDLAQAAPVSHAYLFDGDRLTGLAIIAAPTHESAEATLWRELALELMAPYLAVKLASLMSRRQDRLLASVREKALRAAQRLMTAVDVESVLASALMACCDSLGFSVGQYVRFERGGASADSATISPEVLMEYSQGQIRSYLHAGLRVNAVDSKSCLRC